VLLPEDARSADGAGAAVALCPGFRRLALLLDVSAWGGAGLQVYVQHSADGGRWMDLAAFEPVTGAGAQVAWVEAQPEIAGTVCPADECTLAPGTVQPGFACSKLRVRWTLSGPATHSFAVEAVAIYERNPR
jgi:hypothetical protein